MHTWLESGDLGGEAMTKVFRGQDLPHFASTRDRLDLVTGDVPVVASRLHLGIAWVAETTRLSGGTSVHVLPGEVHWFENDGDGEFSFVELWAPPPTETIWTVEGDRCTWTAST